MGKRPPAERAPCSVVGCPADSALDPQGSKVCREHQVKLRGRLAEAPGILIDLRVTISRQDRMIQHSGKAAEAPLPWNDRAALADQRLRAAITLMALDVAGLHTDERDQLAPAMAQGHAEVARWLIRNRDTLAKLPAAGSHWESLDSAVFRARAATDRPQVKTRFVVGPCPQVQGEGDAYPGLPCPGEVWALVPESEDDYAVIRCLTCSARWSADQWRRLAKRITARVEQSRHDRYPDPRD